MGTTANNKLAEFLFGKTRRSLLALFFGRPNEAFYINQLIQTTGAGSGAVQRELKVMTEAGILSHKSSGNLVYYQANPQSPVFGELKHIVNKTLGMAASSVPVDTIAERFNVPRDRLVEYCRRHHIKKLSLFGSVLRDDFKPDSDIDVLVEFEPGHVPGFAIIDMETELSRLVGHKIDLRTPGDLSRYFRDSVVREARVEYTDAG